MNRGGPLKRRTHLRSRGKPQAKAGWRADMQRQRAVGKAARDAELYARRWGCEYTSDYLGRWRDPCPLCGLWRPPFVRHHLTRRGNGGLAEDLVLICWWCDRNVVHATRAASAPPLLEQERLRPIADFLAAQGHALGYLPVERCDICGIWHSARNLVDLVEPGKSLRRACTALGWYARKAKPGTAPCVVDVLP